VIDDRLFGDAAAQRIMRATLVFLALVQVALLVWIGNGLSPLADPYSESDAIRSSQGFVEHGLTWNAGLPNILYGERFADRGWKGSRYAAPLPGGGVYTRYPPLPNWIAAVNEHVFGFERMWAWRLFPIACGLAAFAVLLASLSRTFGPDRAALVGMALALAPMTSTHMHSLHYHGYAHALLMLQIALALRTFWSPEGATPRRVALFLLLGFLQGWLSFDLAFVVAFLAIPLWLFRRAEVRSLSPRGLIVVVLACGTGFTLAHALHFLEVAAFYGSVDGAVADYANRAQFRFKGTAESRYLPLLVRALLSETVTVTRATNHFFGPMLTVVVVLVTLLLLSRRIAIDFARRPGVRAIWSGDRARDRLPALGAALVVSATWYFAMPSMTIIHHHIVPRLLFLTYLVCVLTLVVCVRREPVAAVVPSPGPHPFRDAAEEGAAEAVPPA
jgi:hypothetical protein